ncbi:MAG TPA: hypothetical protein DEO32_06140 [Ruminococcaceae bacterium]|nr:hypothetical protein [Oscillospiraceae bacterium]
MKFIKMFISAVLAAIFAASALAGCSDNKTETKVSFNTNYTAPEGYRNTDGVHSKTTLQGSGKNSLLTPSITLCGKTYTLGKSKVDDLLKNGWKKSEDNWTKFPSERVMAVSPVNVIAKKLENGEGSDKKTIYISFRNVTSKPVKVGDCAISRIEIEGRLDTFRNGAGICMFDGKLKLKSCDDVLSFENQLKNYVSKVTRTVDGYYYTTYNKYSLSVKDGSANISVTTDSSTGGIRSITASVTLSKNFAKN